MSLKFYIKIHPDDNIAVITGKILKGDPILLEGLEHRPDQDLNIGDKIALCKIEKGSQVIKYGISIGTATESMSIGCWVHLHNLESNYLRTYVLEK